MQSNCIKEVKNLLENVQKFNLKSLCPKFGAKRVLHSSSFWWVATYLTEWILQFQTFKMIKILLQ